MAVGTVNNLAAMVVQVAVSAEIKMAAQLDKLRPQGRATMAGPCRSTTAALLGGAAVLLVSAGKEMQTIHLKKVETAEQGKIGKALGSLVPVVVAAQILGATVTQPEAQEVAELVTVPIILEVTQ